METFDGEVLDHTLDWLDRTTKKGEPFFCWFNTTAIHVWSHPQKKYVQKAVDEGRAEEDVVRASAGSSSQRSSGHRWPRASSSPRT